jgi:hypothetical protein
MTDVVTVSTALHDAEAGVDLAMQIRRGLDGGVADAIIVFASSQNDYGALLDSLQKGSGARTIAGCSSAGEFTSDTSGTGMSSAIALRSPEMRFTSVLARDLSTDRQKAAEQLARGFSGLETSTFRYRNALVLVDALAGHAEDLVDRLTLATGGMYRFFGGGAGDDANFAKTFVFSGTEAATNAVVALEILSNKQLGIGARHGWSAAGDALRVTETADSCVVSLNVAPAVEAFEEHATATNQRFDSSDPLPFFLHNIVGVKTDDGYKLRVPLGVGGEGQVVFAAEVPTGSTAQIMSTGAASAVAAAASATRDAMQQVERDGNTPKAALFFDCVATRLRLGQEFGKELDAVAKELKDARFVGFNSYGQIVRAEDQFSGFHNCTAVVCVIPE